MIAFLLRFVLRIPDVKTSKFTKLIKLFFSKSGVKAYCEKLST